MLEMDRYSFCNLQEATMRRFLGTLVTLALLLSASAALAQKAYKNDDLASDAIRLEEQVRKSAGSAGQTRTLDQLRRDAAQFLQRGDALGALRPIATALTASPQDAGLWLLYARTAVAAAGLANADTYTLGNAALAAAYLSYERATRPADEAAALATLGEIYAGQEMWRPSLNAYRASLDRLDNPAVRSTYEAERAEHGFRIVDYKVDSDSASPRVCFQFSDPLARGKVDFSPFVVVSGSTNAAISSEEQQLCVEGLEHGERYAIVLREGLPSAVGEQLLKSADYDIYVRDRAPQVRFTAKNYVLPRVGQEGIPVVSVNTTKVAVDVLRIGDRNLLSTRALRRFPVADRVLQRETADRRRRRQDLVRHARRENRSQQGRDHCFSGARGGRQARAGRLRDDRARRRQAAQRAER